MPSVVDVMVKLSIQSCFMGNTPLREKSGKVEYQSDMKLHLEVLMRLEAARVQTFGKMYSSMYKKDEPDINSTN
jgi:hypothetical protein